MLEGGSDALRYVYLGTKDYLDHHLEHVWATPEHWALAEILRQEAAR